MGALLVGLERCGAPVWHPARLKRVVSWWFLEAGRGVDAGIA
ncbi:MAG: hypothetical protein QXI90_03695 [Thermofilum sp.]